jgi:DNA-binding response OmpR family regulator
MAKILVVDDEATACVLLAKYFGGCGHVVRTALSAEEARLVTREFAPDALIADWLLTDATGLDVAVRLRREWPNLGVIFSSGLPEQQISAAAGVVRGSVLLEKPVELAEMRAALERVLEAPCGVRA